MLYTCSLRLYILTEAGIQKGNEWLQLKWPMERQHASNRAHQLDDLWSWQSFSMEKINH